MLRVVETWFILTSRSYLLVELGDLRGDSAPPLWGLNNRTPPLQLRLGSHHEYIASWKGLKSTQAVIPQIPKIELLSSPNCLRAEAMGTQ